MQTGASAGSSIAAGVIFTIPALVILGYWQDFNTLGAGDRRPRRPARRAVLGAAAPLADRRSDRSPFPEGKAAAEVLKAGENPGQGVKILGAVGAGRRRW